MVCSSGYLTGMSATVENLNGTAYLARGILIGTTMYIYIKKIITSGFRTKSTESSIKVSTIDQGGTKDMKSFTYTITATFAHLPH